MSWRESSKAADLKVARDAKSPWLIPATSEMVALDRAVIASGVSASDLMERAGRAIALRIAEIYPDARRVAVLCGSGNNGGDGLVIARLLRERGLEVCSVVVAAKRYSAECEARLRADTQTRLFGSSASDISSMALKPIDSVELRAELERSDLVIDALLGTGQNQAPKGAMLELVQLLGESLRAKVVAVDIPTGINADTGQLFEPHVKADLTVTVQYIKRGMLLFPARAVCGVIEAVAVGIEGGADVEFSLIESANLPRIAPRLGDAHKGLLGRVLIVGGSAGMPGAAYLAALGALRGGAGIVSRLARRSWSNLPALPEAILELIPGDGDSYNSADIGPSMELIERYDTVVLGPGITTNGGVGEFVAGVLDGVRGKLTKVVVDADALNLIASHRLSLSEINAVVTPHPGEAARLLGASSVDVQIDRFAAARELANRLGVVCVLKGAGTVVYDPSRGSGALIVEGTPFLATPGSGDVLSGVIASCSERAGSLFDAALVGAYAHARAGVEAAIERGGTILASEVAAHIRGW